MEKNPKPKQETDLSHLNDDEIGSIIEKTEQILQSEDKDSLAYKITEKTNRSAKQEKEKRQTSASATK